MASIQYDIPFMNQPLPYTSRAEYQKLIVLVARLHLRRQDRLFRKRHVICMAIYSIYTYIAMQITHIYIYISAD
jgi:predicted protein tyrosine phosphatase